jgi:hypothetical protein
MEVTNIEKFSFTQLVITTPVTINYGDGRIVSLAAGTYNFPNANIVNTYASPFTGQIVISSTNLTGITTLSISSNGASTYILPQTTGSVGSPSGFPVYIEGSELVKLDGLTTLSLTNLVLISGATTLDFARTLQSITVSWADVSGTISNLPDAVPVAKTAQVVLGNFNTVSGNLSTMPASYRTIDISGSNTISGNISSLQAHVGSFSVLGANTLTGNIANIPNSYSSTTVTSSVLRTFNVQGYNTLSGSIREFDIERIQFLSIVGEDDPGNPGTGGNTISGSIDAGGGDTRLWNTASNFTILQVLGKNIISGDLSTLSASTGLIRLAIDGKLTPSAGNTISGNLSSITGLASLNRLILNGDTSVTGNLSSLSGLSLLQTALFAGQNTIAGDLSSLPTSIYRFGIEGNCTVNAYSVSKEKASTMNAFNVVPTNAPTNRLSAADLERLVIDLDQLVSTTGSRGWNKFEGVTLPRIILYGQWSSPSAPALAAYNSLVAKFDAIQAGLGATNITITNYP